MYEEHPAFEKPKNEHAEIWRYMDFTKFVSLLDNSALYFTRADKLGDLFEGSMPRPNVEERPFFYTDTPLSTLKTVSQFRVRLLRHTVINCWHVSEHESEAMWRLYSNHNGGIAIRSTFSKLRDSLVDSSHRIHIGMVKYTDYRRDRIPESSSFHPFLHKRMSFRHERELRAIAQSFRYKRSGAIDLRKPPYDNGAYIEVDLSMLLDRIYVAPATPKWLRELVESTAAKYDVRVEFVQSALGEEPIY
jgi:hypothetical protein